MKKDKKASKIVIPESERNCPPPKVGEDSIDSLIPIKKMAETKSIVKLPDKRDTEIELLKWKVNELIDAINKLAVGEQPLEKKPWLFYEEIGELKYEIDGDD